MLEYLLTYYIEVFQYKWSLTLCYSFFHFFFLTVCTTLLIILVTDVGEMGDNCLVLLLIFGPKRNMETKQLEQVAQRSNLQYSNDKKRKSLALIKTLVMNPHPQEDFRVPSYFITFMVLPRIQLTYSCNLLTGISGLSGNYREFSFFKPTFKRIYRNQDSRSTKE